jgi:hypothetical protein
MLVIKRYSSPLAISARKAHEAIKVRDARVN